MTNYFKLISINILIGILLAAIPTIASANHFSKEGIDSVELISNAEGSLPPTCNPVFDSPPDDITVSCYADVEPDLDITWSDDCSGSGSVTAVESENITGAGNCENREITREWEYIEPGVDGITITHTQVITVFSVGAPVLDGPPWPVTVTCHLDIPIAPDVSYTEVCGLTGIATVTDNGTIDNCTGGTITRIFSHTDDCGNQVNYPQFITVEAIAPILWTGTLPGDITINCGDPAPALEDIAYSNGMGASGCAIDDVASPIVSGSVTNCGDQEIRTYDITDPCGNQITHVQTISVEDTAAPTFDAPPGDIALDCYSDLGPIPDLAWTDNCDGTGTASGIESGSVDNCAGGVLTRTWEHTDICGGLTVTHIQTITINAVADIDWTSALPGDISITCSESIPNMDDLDYDNAVSGSCANAGSAPGVESGSLTTCGDQIIRTWTVAADAANCINEITHTQTITLIDNTDPVLVSPPADISYDCLADVPAMADLEWSDDCAAGGFVSGVESGTVEPCAGGDLTRTWVVADDCTNEITHIQTITINPAPSITWTTTLPPDITLSCGDPVPPSIDLDYSDNQSNASCEESGTVNPAEVGTLVVCGDEITRTWDITSACGTNLNHVQTITLEDTEAPIFTDAPANLVFDCFGDVPPIADLTWTDNCDGTGTVTPVETGSIDNCAQSVITRTSTYTDQCGNPLTHIQTITVDPIPDITWTSTLPSDVTISCGDPVPPTVDLDYSNGSSNALCLFSGTESPTESGTLTVCGDQITRTWTVPADSGNCISELTHTLTITLQDTEAPTFTSLPPATVTVSCVADIPASQDLDWSDNCDGTGTVPYTESGSPDPCTGGSISRTWEYTDNCGNGPISFTQTYTIDAPIQTSCDDGDDCTDMDMETVACDGTICIPCQGIVTDCSGLTTLQACSDDNPCTENDMEEVGCDGSICVPCMGTLIASCSGIVPNEIIPCDDGDDCTINDVMEVDGCDTVTECVPCAGTPNPTPDPTAPSGEVTCENEPITLTINDCAGTVTWYDGIGGTILGTGVSYTTDPLTSPTSFYATCSVNGCESNPIEIPVDVIPPPSPTITGPNLICNGQETITLSADAGYDSYDWGAGPSSSPDFDVTGPGTYTVIVTDIAGCTASTDYTVDPATLPTVLISGSDTYCIGGFTTLTGDSGFAGYLWSPNGETTETIDASSPGAYSLEVTDVNGCTASASITVIEATELNPMIVGDLEFCEGGSTNLSVGPGFTSITWAPNGETTEDIVANAPGTYSVTVSDALGCTGTATVEVIENPNPIPTITGGPDICSNSTLTLDAGGPYSTYEWGDGSGGQTLNITTDGTYNVTVTDANGCDGTAEIIINAIPDPVVDITGDNLICPGGSDMITLTATDGYANYAWSAGGSTTNEAVISSAGSYTVTVTDASGCTNTASFEVMLDEPPTVDITGSLIFCSTLSTTLSATDGLSSYAWSSGENTNEITVSTPGPYTVTVTDTDGCTNTATVTVTELTELMPIIEGNLDICPGDYEEVTLTVNGTFVDFDWGSGPGTDNTLLITGPGTYNVTVSDANGCTGNSSVVVVENTVAEVTISGGPEFCEGTNLTLTASAGFDSYNWSNGSSGASIDVGSEATYTVTATDSNGCTNTADVVVTEVPNPIPTLTGPTEICQGASATLDAGTWDAYNWSNGATTQTVDVTLAGPYSVTVTDANGCVGSTDMTLIVHELPTPEITGPNSFCLGGWSDLALSESYAGYVWTGGSTDATFTATDPGDYTVTVTDANGCTASTTIVITLEDFLYPLIAGPNLVCTGSSITLNITQPFDGYIWGDGSSSESLMVTTAGTYEVTVSDLAGCTGTSAYVVTEEAPVEVNIAGIDYFCEGLSTTLVAEGDLVGYEWSNGENSGTNVIDQVGTYTVTATDANGCTSTDQMEITSSPNPTPTIDGAAQYCVGESHTLTVNETYTAYEWSNGEMTQAITTDIPGSYTVTVTDEFGCIGIATLDISLYPLADPIILGPGVFCLDGYTEFTVEGWESAIWSTGETTETIEVGTEGDYTVTVTDINGCTNSSTVTAIEQLELLPIITGNLDICEGSYTSLSPGPGYATYEWSNGLQDQIVNIEDSGTYSVTVTDNYGCSGNSSIEINVVPSPEVELTGEVEVCEGGMTEIFATPGFNSYEWSPSGSGESIIVDNPGTYSVTVYDENGCNGFASLYVDFLPLPEPYISGNAAYCYEYTTPLSLDQEYASYEWSTGETTETVDAGVFGSIYVTVTDEKGCTGEAEFEMWPLETNEPEILGSTTFCSGGSTILDAGPFVEYEWFGPVDGEDQYLEADIEGEYTVYVTDYNGCTASSSVVVSIGTSLEPSINEYYSFCAGGSVILDAGIFDSYEWDGPEDGNTQTLEVSTPGTYSLTVTEGSCAGTAEIVVEDFPSPTPIIEGASSICGGASTVLNVVSTDQILWSNGATSQSITVDQVGNYSITVTDINGCTGASSMTVTEVAAPVVTIAGDAIFCPGGSTILDAGAFSEYLWSTGETTQTINGSTAGTVTVTITDPSGCTGIGTITLSEQIVEPLSIGGSTSFCAGSSTILDGGSQYSNWIWSTGETTQTIEVSTEGNIGLSVMDQNGCELNTDVNISQETNLNITILGDNTICMGENAILDAGNFDSWVWSGPEGSFNTQTIEVSTPGTYSVEVDNGQGCSGYGEIILAVNEIAVPEILGNVNICPQEETTLSINNNYTSYEWSNGETTATISTSIAGDYTVTVIDQFGCEAMAQASIVASAGPSVNIIGSDKYCQGETVTLEVGDFESYQWSIPNATGQTLEIGSPGVVSITVTDANGCEAVDQIELSAYELDPLEIFGSTSYCTGSFTVIDVDPTWTSVVWSTGETENSIQVSTEGIYSVTVTDSNGCEIINQANIIQDDNLAVNLVPSTDVLCEGTTADISAGTAFDQYEWSNGVSGQSTISIDEPGEFTVTVTDQGGCTGTGVVTISGSSINEPVTANPVMLCEGSETNISLTETYASYEWSTGETTPTIDIENGGNYTVTVTNSSGCIATNTINATENSLELPVIDGEAFYCNNGSTTLTVDGFDSYLWSVAGENGSTIEITTEGTYSVTVTDAFGCQTSNSIFISPYQTEQAQIGGSTSFCIGSSTQLSGGDDWAEYLWSTGETTQSIDIATIGSIGLTVTDSNGCTSFAGTTVSEESSLNPVLIGLDKLCPGDTNILDAGSGFGSYVWSTGETSQSIEIDVEGTYAVTVSDISGDCTGETDISVELNELTVPTFIAPTILCPEDANVISIVEAYASYEWSTGEQLPSINIIGGGDYIVTVTDELGCTSVNTVSIENENTPTYSVMSVNCSADMSTYEVLVQTDAMTLTNSLSMQADEVNPGEFLFSSIDTSLSFQVVLSSGGAGCETTFAVDAPNCACTAIVNAGTDQLLSCDITEVTLGDNETSTGAIYEYQWIDEQGTVIGDQATVTVSIGGNYTFIVTDTEMDCSVIDQVFVDTAAQPQPSISGEEIICESTETTIEVNEDFASYQWSNGDSGQSIIVSETGTYEVTVADADGCEGINAIFVEVIATPQLNVIGLNCSESMDTYSIQLNTTAEGIEIDINNTLIDLGNGNYEINDIDTSISVNFILTSGSLNCSSAMEIEAPNCLCDAVADAGVDQVIDCSTGTVTIDASASSTGAIYTYEWKNELGQTISSELNATIDLAGLYTLIVTDTDADCSVQDVIEIMPPTLPFPIILGEARICEGDNTTLVLPETYEEYRWSDNSTNSELTVSQNGNYSVTITNTEGCQAVAEFQVEVVAAPSLTLMDLACSEDELSYTVIIQTEAENIETDLGITATNVGPNLYEIIAININDPINIMLSNSTLNCSIDFDFNPPNCNCDAIADAGEPGVIDCNTESVTIGGDFTSNGDNIQITWYNELGEVISNEQFVEVAQAGFYTLEVLDLLEDCSVISSTQVTEAMSEPIAIILSSTNNVIDCTLTSVELYVTPEANTSYNWLISNTETTGTNINVAEDGEVILMAIDTITGCLSSDTIMIQDMSEYPLILIEEPLTLDCQNNEVALNASTPIQGNNLTIEWFDVNGDPISATDFSATVQDPGTYFIQITDIDNGCSNLDSITVVQEIYYPQIEAGQDLLIPCDVTDVQVEANITGNEDGRDFSYNWTTDTGNIVTGANQLTPMVDQPGTYYVEIMDLASGCVDIDSLVVTIADDKPYGIDSEVMNPPCSNDESGMINVTEIAGGTGPFNYTINGSISNDDGIFENLGAGTYELLIQDQNGCVHDTIFEINYEHEVGIEATPAVIEIAYQEDAFVQLSSNIDWDEISELEWNNTSGLSCEQCFEPTISTETNQDYMVTIYDIYGCSDTTTFRVLVEKEENIYAPNIITPGSNSLKDQKFTLYADPGVERIEELYIYDRWGELMFSATDIPPNKTYYGWDGTLKGKDVVPGVYVWIAKYRMVWGTTDTAKGDVTVLK